MAEPCWSCPASPPAHRQLLLLLLPAPRSAHWLKSVFQLPRMKSQASGCPTTLLAMLLMVEVASCLRILVESRVYCRYLGGGSCQVRGCGGRAGPPPDLHPPLEDPGFSAAGQGRAQLVGLGHHRSLEEALPYEVPRLLPACGHGAAVDGGAQVWGDAVGERCLSTEPSLCPASLCPATALQHSRVVADVVLPLVEELSGQLLALSDAVGAGCADGIDLVVPGGESSPQGWDGCTASGTHWPHGGLCIPPGAQCSECHTAHRAAGSPELCGTHCSIRLPGMVVQFLVTFL